MSVGAGAQSLIINQVKSMGTDLIGVLPGSSDEKGPPASVFGIVITTLRYEDIRAVMSGNFPHITAAAVYVRGLDTVIAGDRKAEITFIGTTAELPEVENTEVVLGRFFGSEEERGAARVAVLGDQAKTELFGDDDAIGRQIKIKKTNFIVIGVMKKRGASGFQNQDNQIFIPVSTAQKILLGIDHISMARFKVDNAENVEESIEHIKQTLRDRHDIDNPEDDDFSVRSMAQGLEVLTTTTNALKMFLTFVAAIALLVGGIGIMNIMLAAVEERTREIGLRKAVGAKNRHIVSQFLVETIMITLIGGMIGIALGVLISFSVAKVAQNMGYSWDYVVTFSSILIACVVSIGLGLVFGILPARRASKLDPIEALRYE